MENVSDIAAGSGFSLALRGNGSVVTWGNNSAITNVPSSLQDVVAIAAGGSHALALLADGTVFGWGNNSLGQTDVPGDLDNVIAISAGGGHSVALKADGAVVIGEARRTCPQICMTSHPFPQATTIVWLWCAVVSLF